MNEFDSIEPTSYIKKELYNKSMNSFDNSQTGFDIPDIKSPLERGSSYDLCNKYLDINETDEKVFLETKSNLLKFEHKFEAKVKDINNGVATICIYNDQIKQIEDWELPIEQFGFNGIDKDEIIQIKLYFSFDICLLPTISLNKS